MFVCACVIYDLIIWKNNVGYLNIVLFSGKEKGSILQPLQNLNLLCVICPKLSWGPFSEGSSLLFFSSSIWMMKLARGYEDWGKLIGCCRKYHVIVILILHALLKESEVPHAYFLIVI